MKALYLAIVFVILVACTVMQEQPVDVPLPVQEPQDVIEPVPEEIIQEPIRKAITDLSIDNITIRVNQNDPAARPRFMDVPYIPGKTYVFEAEVANSDDAGIFFDVTNNGREPLDTIDATYYCEGDDLFYGAKDHFFTHGFYTDDSNVGMQTIFLLAPGEQQHFALFLNTYRLEESQFYLINCYIDITQNGIRRNVTIQNYVLQKD